MADVNGSGRISKVSSLVPAVDRAARLLQILKEGRGGYGVSELARMLNASKGTIYEILQTLEHHGLVQHSEDTKKYRLGYSLIEYGRVVLRDIDHREVIHRHVVALRDLTGETVSVCILAGNQTLVIDRVVPDTRLQVNTLVGQLDSAFISSMGKLLLAYLDDDELDKILATTGPITLSHGSFVDERSLRSILLKVREIGYAIDDGDFVEGVRAVSAPIKAHTGKVIAALTAAGSSVRMTDDRMPEIIRQVVEAAERVSFELGAPALS